MADLFLKDVRAISEHIRNIFEEGELRPEAVVGNFRITVADNKPHATPALQSRCHHLRRLPRQVPARHSVLHLGHAAPRRVVKGLHDGRAT